MKPDSVLKCFLLLVSVFAVAEVGLLVRDFRNYSEKSNSSIQEILKNTNETILFARNTVKNVNVVVARLKVATHSWESANKSQAGYFEKLKSDSAQTIGKLNTLADSLNALVQNTDVSVNRVLVPKVDAAIAEATSTIKSTNAGVITATEGVSVALEDIHTILADPSITDSLTAIEGSAKNAEITTGYAAKSAEHIEGYLSPKKMTFWARLLQLLIPKLSIDIK
jgi:hypothetical protein